MGVRRPSRVPQATRPPQREGPRGRPSLPPRPCVRRGVRHRPPRRKARALVSTAKPKPAQPSKLASSHTGKQPATCRCTAVARTRPGSPARVGQPAWLVSGAASRGQRQQPLRRTVTRLPAPVVGARFVPAKREASAPAGPAATPRTVPWAAPPRVGQIAPLPKGTVTRSTVVGTSVGP